ncbi:prolipoprotein diacylglyceryl transferase [Synechococcus sp. CC9616]|uniref:prolipoprotein diacylglyceryl transferase n=1 Tax=Synechococcus sp. CC9616 TaxID=110663 RepID=UPI00048BA924|nr:prolipoprotein diacylglyceryl transferase [Synechococcus sp. CC9616]|tara:strand:- start:88 stop:927 length:840 start_codon:yes stop_codon:yes gene_type:complete
MFTSPGPELIQLGPFTLRWYGLLIAAAVLIGLNLSSRLARSRDLDNGLISDLLPLLVLASVLGARAYYVAFEWRNYSDNWIKALAIWEGGIAIHGALIAGTLTLILFCRWRRQSFWDLLDVLVPSLALGQAIGRWGNFFNSEAFGVPTDLPWKLFIPYQNRPVVYADAQFFHPTFLYESIWNLVLFLLLIVLFRRGEQGKMTLPSGALACTYLLGYSLGRIWIEGLRIDPLCLGALPPACEGGLRIAQLVSGLLMLAGAAGLFWLYARHQALPDPAEVR